MSAALQLPAFWPLPRKQEQDNTQPSIQAMARSGPQSIATGDNSQRAGQAPDVAQRPSISMAFYRKHTEKMLRRYLYASMQVGRAPSILGSPVARGWASSRPIKTFEDAVIFVLDVETCLNKLGSLDRQMLCRVVLQEYTQAEAANMLGMSVRTISYKFPLALDRLTEKLLEADLLILPA